jgi:transposase
MSKRHSEEFKREAVRLILTSGKSVKQMAQELGVNQWTLRDWKEKYNPEKPENEELKISAEERIRQLERENTILRQECDILKKAVGIVSK